MQPMMEEPQGGMPQEREPVGIANLDWPDEVRASGEKAARALMKVLENKEVIVDFLDNGSDLATAAATLVATHIGEAEKRFGDLPDEILYGTGGLAELAMAIVFQAAEEAGIEGATDQAIYDEANALADEMAGYTGEEEAEPEVEDEPAGFDENRAGPPRGKPVMAM